MQNDYLLRKSKVTQTNRPNNTRVNNTKQPPKQSFDAVLQQIQSSGEVKFSKHALSRLEQRNIKLTAEDITKINGAVDKAAKKGVKDALIMMDNKVFVANIKNKTVITAAADDQLKDNVFTNIDGAVII